MRKFRAETVEIKPGKFFSETFNRHVNVDYLKTLNEVPIMLGMFLFPRHTVRLPRIEGDALIVLPCLIGEFIAALPALKSFIDRNRQSDFDLLVSPNVAPLARKIKGIRRVLTARTVHQRESERRDHSIRSHSYSTVLVLRMSPDAHRILRNINYRTLYSSVRPTFKYSLGTFILGKPIQWSNFVCDALEVLPAADRRNILDLGKAKPRPRNIILHVNANWHMRMWARKRWIELIKHIHTEYHMEFTFIGSGKDDTKECEAIASQLGFRTRSLIGKDILQATLAIRNAGFFIGLDSGPRNIADFLDVPSLVLLGPSLHNFEAVSRKAVVIDKIHKSISTIFTLKHISPLEDVSVDDVFLAWQALYKKYGKAARSKGAR